MPNEVILDTDVSGFGVFDAGTSDPTGERHDFDLGRLLIRDSVTATATLSPALTSGRHRVDLWFLVDDTETVAGSAKNHFLYILPTAGGAPSSANSITTINISRDTALGATASLFAFQYRDSAAFVNIPQVHPMRRGAWIKLSVIFNFTTDQFDIMINDQLWQRNIAVANSSAADVSRIVLLSNASITDASRLKVGRVKVTKDWTTDESTLVQQSFPGSAAEIETLTPDTDARHPYPQKWRIPNDQTTYGGLTRGANGLSPDAAKQCMAFFKGYHNGTLEMQVKTSASGGSAISFEALVRVWSGLESALSTDRSFIKLRFYSGGGAATWSLFAGGAKTDAAVQTANTPAISSNTVYTIKIEFNGRYIDCWMKAGTIGDATAYTRVFAAGHLINSNATGARGQLSEETFGIGVDTTLAGVLTDNRIEGVKFTAKVEGEIDKIIGNRRFVINHGSVRQLYDDRLDAATANLFFSKGVQYGHRSGSDMSPVSGQKIRYNTANLLMVEQRALNFEEDRFVGHSTCKVTATRRGLFIRDLSVAWGSSIVNISPDLDLAPEHWSTVFRHAASTGAGASFDDATFHDWTVHRSAQALELVHQSITNPAGGSKLRLNQVLGNTAGWSGIVHAVTSKYLGAGDPISRAFERPTANVADGNTYEVRRAFLIETGDLALDDAIMTGWRDDVQSYILPLTFATGSLKTDALGDDTNDGFNEDTGWTEINCDAATGLADFDVDITAVTRIQPQFRFSQWQPANTKVLIDGDVLTQGVDYWIDNLGDGSALLQLNGTFAANFNLELQVGTVRARYQQTRFCPR